MPWKTCHTETSVLHSPHAKQSMGWGGGRGEVSNLVFYAQSTIAVISGWWGGGGGGAHTEKEQRNYCNKNRERETDRDREMGGGGGEYKTNTKGLVSKAETKRGKKEGKNTKPELHMTSPPPPPPTVFKFLPQSAPTNTDHHTDSLTFFLSKLKQKKERSHATMRFIWSVQTGILILC